MKIGLFDSGSGLFTVAQAIRRQNPQADLILYSDLANMPYGEKSQAELTALMLADLQALQKAGAELYVSACNTLSVAVLQPIFELFGAPAPKVIEMVEPLARELLAEGITNVTVVGTPATVESGMYTHVLAAHGIQANAIALPGLAAAIEEERLADASAIIEKNLMSSRCAPVGILACTHYPLVKNIFEQVALNTRWIDPADAVARTVLALAGSEGSGQLNIITTAPQTPTYKKLAAGL